MNTPPEGQIHSTLPVSTSTGMNPTPESLDRHGPSVPSSAADRPVDALQPVQVVSELMLLPDGRILAHHLTPELAALLRTALDSDKPTTHPDPRSP